MFWTRWKELCKKVSQTSFNNIFFWDSLCARRWCDLLPNYFGHFFLWKSCKIANFSWCSEKYSNDNSCTLSAQSVMYVPHPSAAKVTKPNHRADRFSTQDWLLRSDVMRRHVIMSAKQLIRLERQTGALTLTMTFSIINFTFLFTLHSMLHARLSYAYLLPWINFKLTTYIQVVGFLQGLKVVINSDGCGASK